MAKAKCSGIEPCLRCSRKSFTCTFPSPQLENEETEPTLESTNMTLESNSRPAVNFDVPQEDSGDGNNIHSTWIDGSTATGLVQAEGNQGDLIPQADVMLDTSQEYQPEISQFDLDHSSGYELGRRQSDFNGISSFNWLPPGFDFDIDEMAYHARIPTSAILQPQLPTTNMAMDTETRASGISPNVSLDTHDTSNQSEFANHQFPVEGYAKPARSGDEDADGPFYVSGTGSRLPRNGKYAKSISNQHSSSYVPTPELVTGYALADQEILHDDDIPVELLGRQYMSNRAYEDMSIDFNRLCVGTSGLFEAFEEQRFPSLNVFNTFISAYIHHFHPVFPFLHLPTVDFFELPWMFSLALAAVGSQYISSRGLKTTIGLHEFLRRVLLFSVSIDMLTVAPLLIPKGRDHDPIRQSLPFSNDTGQAP